jgi:hypothetical protein
MNDPQTYTLKKKDQCLHLTCHPCNNLNNKTETSQHCEHLTTASADVGWMIKVKRKQKISFPKEVFTVIIVFINNIYNNT